MAEAKEVEDMKEFMTILMEVKVSMADLNGKVDNIIDIKNKVNTTYDMASKTESRSLENEKDIASIQEKMSTKASKEHVQRIVQENDNWKKNLPGYLAVVMSAIAIIVSIIFYMGGH